MNWGRRPTKRRSTSTLPSLLAAKADPWAELLPPHLEGYPMAEKQQQQLQQQQHYGGHLAQLQQQEAALAAQRGMQALDTRDLEQQLPQQQSHQQHPERRQHAQAHEQQQQQQQGASYEPAAAAYSGGDGGVCRPLGLAQSSRRASREGTEPWDGPSPDGMSAASHASVLPWQGADAPEAQQGPEVCQPKTLSKPEYSLRRRAR